MKKQTQKEDKYIHYASLISAQIASMFKEDCEYYISIDELAEDDNATQFIHALATLAPANLYCKLTHQDLTGLEFNHVANVLCFQFQKHD